MIAPEIAGLIGIIILLGLILMRVPIAFCFGIVGFLGTTYLLGFKAGGTVLFLNGWSQTIHYTLMCLPLFVLMGEFIKVSGIAGDLYDMFYSWVGQFPGGLSIATIGSCAGFAACCGSSLAGVVTMGSIAYPEMRRMNYDKKLALGSIASAGTLEILIPPSNIFVIYAVITDVSLGRLFIAGILPGLLLTAAMIAMVYVRCTLNPTLGPKAPPMPLRQRVGSLYKGIIPFGIFLLVIGGIWMGWFTPTEASAIGAFSTFLFVILRAKLSRESLVTSLIDTGRITCMIFLILIMAHSFGHFLAVSRLPMWLADFLRTVPLSPSSLMLLILGIYIPLGCFMEVIAMLVLTLPIFVPTVVALGYDLIWFGICVTLLSEMAQISPPVGLAVYVIKGIAPDGSLEEAFAGIFWFFVVMLFVLGVIFYFPQIALFLPNLMKG